MKSKQFALLNLAFKSVCREQIFCSPTLNLALCIKFFFPHCAMFHRYEVNVLSCSERNALGSFHHDFMMSLTDYFIIQEENASANPTVIDFHLLLHLFPSRQAFHRIDFTSSHGKKWSRRREGM